MTGRCRVLSFAGETDDLFYGPVRRQIYRAGVPHRAPRVSEIPVYKGR